MKRMRLPLALTLLLSLSPAACGAKQPPPPVEPNREGPASAGAAASERTLYDRLGGRNGIDAIVDAFLKNLIADPRVSDFFTNNKDGLPKFRMQLCQLSGGPCQYGGKNMKAAHIGMGISGTQFDAFMQDFLRALDEKGVSQQDKSDLFSVFAPMRSDIVEKKAQR